MRQPRYQSIADDLRRRVDAGEFAAGRLLPSESELSNDEHFAHGLLTEVIEGRGAGRAAARARALRRHDRLHLGDDARRKTRAQHGAARLDAGEAAGSAENAG